MIRAAVAPARLLGLALLLFGGLAVGVLLFPWLGQPARNRIIRRWSVLLCAVCGLRVRRAGVEPPPALADTGILAWSSGRLVLANHISWIDIFALNAVLPARFVAKAEIGRWPLLGRLVALAGTIFIERGRRHAVAAINRRVREALQAGESVVVFPEGTTTDGTHLLPFHANLLAPAVDSGAAVWPVALRYTADAQPTLAAAFIGEQTLPESLWQILTARRLAVEVTLLAPLAPAGATRHHLAALAEAAIAAALAVPIRPAAGLPGAGSAGSTQSADSMDSPDRVSSRGSDGSPGRPDRSRSPASPDSPESPDSPDSPDSTDGTDSTDGARGTNRADPRHPHPRHR